MKVILGMVVATFALMGGYFGYQQFFGSPDATPQVAQSQGNQGKPGNASGKPGAGAPGSRRGGGGRPPPLIIASPVDEALINDRLKAVGNGTAMASVSVVPLSGGVLEEVMVQAGQRVEANSVLARLDDEEQLIARDRAARAAAEAESDLARLEELFRTRTTTQVEVNRAKAAFNDATLALRDAELKLARRTITAPISGVVGLVSVDTGNFINAQTELMTIDDRSQLEVEFWVPERFASQIQLDQNIEAVALASPGTLYKGTISGIGSRIEPDSRTLPLRAKIDNASDALRPGMSFELTLNFPGQSFPAINPLAIQWDSNGSYVWQVVDSQVQRVSARIVQRNPEAILVQADLKAGDMVASEGLLALRPGLKVRVEGAAAKPDEQGKPDLANGTAAASKSVAKNTKQPAGS